jgi:hypothetical protein
MVMASGKATATSDARDNAIERTCPGVTTWEASQRARGIVANGANPTSTDVSRHVGQSALRQQLLHRATDDQHARNAWIAAHGQQKAAALKTQMAVDAANLAWLKAHIAEHGVPTVGDVGADGTAALWTLVQHADSDAGFQQQMLAAWQPRLATKDIDPAAFAMLTDRVLRHQGKPQRYGSQFVPDPAPPGTMVMQPTEDVEHLDQRRASVGLMPISEYRCVLGVVYGGMG